MNTIKNSTEMLKNPYMRIVILFAIGSCICGYQMLVAMITYESLSLTPRYLETIKWALLFIIGNQFCYCIGRNFLKLKGNTLFLRIIGVITFGLLSLSFGSTLGGFFPYSSIAYTGFSIFGALLNFGTYCFGLYSAVTISNKISGYSLQLR